MAREREQTLIIVTHDTEISEYADQIIHVRDGLIESIKNTPKKETVKNEKETTSIDNTAIDTTDGNIIAGI
jgi:putative ABC transport system ATP-binding protein